MPNLDMVSSNEALNTLEGITEIVTGAVPGNVAYVKGGKVVTAPLCQPLPVDVPVLELDRNLFYTDDLDVLHYLDADGLLTAVF